MALAKNKLKLNITLNDSSVSSEEQDKKLVDFFAMLFEWQLEELADSETQAE
jgi:hypothetical protein